MSISNQELHGGIGCIVSVAEAVQTSKRIPAGTLYAAVISILVKAHCVQETAAHELVWIGGN